MLSDASTTSAWVALPKAAKHLDTTHAALKKRCQRNVRRTKGGVEEARLAPGIVARKFGNAWLVQFSEGWGGPDNDH